MWVGRKLLNKEKKGGAKSRKRIKIKHRINNYFASFSPFEFLSPNEKSEREREREREKQPYSSTTAAGEASIRNFARISGPALSNDFVILSHFARHTKEAVCAHGASNHLRAPQNEPNARYARARASEQLHFERLPSAR